MTSLKHKTTITLFIALCALAVAAALVPAARAQSFSDVTKKCWARAAIEWVTNQGPGTHKILRDYGDVFRPERAITREQLARSLVIAGGHFGESFTPVKINDVTPGSTPYYKVIQLALKYDYMGLDAKKDFRPKEAVESANAEVAVIRWLRHKYSSYNWKLLNALRPGTWQPVDGWKPAAPSYLPYVVASRQLGLRFNHSTGGDGHETTPSMPIDRAEVAYMFRRAYAVGSSWELYGLADYQDVTFPTLSDRQKEIVTFALKYVGYPYIWAGEWPTTASPYGAQKCGGFDCSGFVFYVMKLHFGYPLTVNERGAHDMAKRAKPRITRAKLKCGDLIFFGPKGPKSSVNSIYHAALYLGNGWFIQSTGSTDGVTISSLNTSSYYKTYFAWGRRLLKASELAAPAQSTPAQSAPAADASPALETAAPSASPAG